MKINKKIFGLLVPFVPMVVLFIEGKTRGWDNNKLGTLMVQTFILGIILSPILWFLNRKDLRTEEQKLKRKRNRNKKVVVWTIGTVIGIVLIWMIPGFLFTNRDKVNSSLWIFDSKLIKSYYMVFCITFYVFFAYVFIFGKTLLALEKKIKFAHYSVSFFTLAIFTAFVISVNVNPDNILVMWCFCVGILFAQFSLINLIKLFSSHSPSDSTFEK